MAVHYEFGQHEPGITVATLTGQLNLGNRVAEFEHTVKERITEGSRQMILDLTGLTYIDSAGLGMVAACAGIIFKASGRMVVVAPAGRIMQMFEITRLNKVIDLYPNLEVAVASFAPPPKTDSSI